MALEISLKQITSSHIERYDKKKTIDPTIKNLLLYMNQSNTTI